MMPDYRKANFNLARELLPPAAWDHINGDINISTIEDTWTVFRDKLLEPVYSTKIASGLVELSFGQVNAATENK